MLEKSTINRVKSLNNKKYRQSEQLFVAEGSKIILELLGSKIQIEQVFATQDWAAKYENRIKANKLVIATQKELERMSGLKSIPDVLMLAKIPIQKFNASLLSNSLTIALDTIQDPGNLGTIIRTADWFGIKNIVCSQSCADVYNNKTIQASMGSFARVNIFYEDLKTLFSENKFQIFGAVLNGKNISEIKPPQNGILLIGNEGNGISTELIPFITQNISIPKYGEAESLNAAVATSIICAHFIMK